jgi:hypothetical protein
LGNATWLKGHFKRKSIGVPWRRIVRWIVLAIAFGSVPFFLGIRQVQAAEPRAQATAGWISITAPPNEFGIYAFVRIRIILDPYYRITDSPSSAVTFPASWLTSPKYYGQFQANYDRPFYGYIILACAQSGYGGISIHGSLILQGSARLEDPLSVSWGPGPAVQRPIFSDMGTLIAHSKFNGLQDFPFKLRHLNTCISDQSPQLGAGSTLLQRGGADLTDGFVVLGMNQEPRLSSGSFLGITGPNREFTTPLVGAIPGGTPGGSGIIFDPLDPFKGALAESEPSGVVIRDLPSSLSFVHSTPTSDSRNMADVLSEYGQSVEVFMRNASSQAFWSRLGFASNLYLTIAVGLIAAVIYDFFFSSSRNEARSARPRMAASVKPGATRNRGTRKGASRHQGNTQTKAVAKKKRRKGSSRPKNR